MSSDYFYSFEYGELEKKEHLMGRDGFRLPGGGLRVAIPPHLYMGPNPHPCKRNFFGAYPEHMALSMVRYGKHGIA